MATLVQDDKKIEIVDGTAIKEACMELDIPFGCQSGICGTCKIEILEGSDNLSPLSLEEQEMGDRDTNHRLGCQAKIMHGIVKIKPEEL
jgi:ferredoxin